MTKLTAYRANARFSDDGKTYAADGRYRLWLEIVLNERTDGILFERAANGKVLYPKVCVGLMMNPSTAKVKDGFLLSDPTVTRLCGFARRENCNRLIVVNVLGLRLTDSKQLHLHPDPFGNPLNDLCIREAFQVADVRIVAWGKLHRRFADRERQVRALLRDIGKPVHALKINGDGSPGHPLYLPNDQPLVEFQP